MLCDLDQELECTTSRGTGISALSWPLDLPGSRAIPPMAGLVDVVFAVLRAWRAPVAPYEWPFMVRWLKSRRLDHAARVWPSWREFEVKISEPLPLLISCRT